MARRRMIRGWRLALAFGLSSVAACSGGGDEQADNTGWVPSPGIGVATSSTALGRAATTSTVATATSSAATSTTRPKPTTSTSAPLAAPSTVEPSGALPVDPGLLVAMKYVGVSAPVGAPAGEPVVVGVVDQVGGAAAFADSSFGIDAAVSLLGTSLGGIAGHPIEVRRCTIRAAADGARCALELVGDPAVRAVVVGTVLDGEAALLEGIAATKPVVLANPLTLRQYAADAVAFTPGLPSVFRGVAIAAFDAGVGYGDSSDGVSVKVIVTDTAAHLNAVGTLAEPALRQLGAEAVDRTVIRAGASAAELDLLLAAVDFSTVDSILLVGEPAACAGLARTLAEATAGGLPWGAVPVVTTQVCLGQPMTDHLAGLGSAGALPEGWMIGGFTDRFSPLAAEQQAATAAALASYATISADLDPPASPDVDASFGAMLSLARVLNGVSADLSDVAVVRAALAGASAPAWGIDGRLDCASQPPFVVLCGTQIRVDQIVSGALVPAPVGNSGIVNAARRLPAA